MASLEALRGNSDRLFAIVRRIFLSLLLVPFSAMAESGTRGDHTQWSQYRMQIRGNDAYLLTPTFRLPLPTTPATSVVPKLPYSKDIADAARDSNVDMALVHAIVSVESGYRQDAVSPKGAVGLMQLMPGTALRYGVATPEKSPAENLRAGTLYLRDLLHLFDNRIDLALAAYNAGEGAVKRYGNRIPPYRETLNYVPAVMGRYEEWKALLSLGPHQPIVYLPGTRLDDKSLSEFRLRAR